MPDLRELGIDSEIRFYAFIEQRGRRPPYVGSVMTLSLSPVSKRMLPLGCLIRKNATGIMNFSLPVAAADNADLAISKGWEVNTYSFIPSGEAANIAI